jgi:hypothetical protein
MPVLGPLNAGAVNLHAILAQIVTGVSTVFNLVFNNVYSPEEVQMQSFSLTKFFCLAAFVFAVYTPTAMAIPVCTTSSLSAYIALNTTGGCTVGDLTFLRFTAPTPTITGSPTVASDSQIILTPILTADGGGFAFSASSGDTNLFSISSPSGTTSVTYYINYSVDPAPVVAGSDLTLDPPFGNVSVTQVYCTSDVLVDNCALGVESQQTVTTASTNSSITFPDPSSFVDIATDISLSATPGNPAGFDSINASVSTAAVTNVPEPSSVLMLSAGSLALLSLLRRKHI